MPDLPANTLKVSVMKDGAVRCDAVNVTLEELDKIFREAAPGTSVLYYREAGSSEPPPQAKQVIDLVIRYKLAISLSSKPDFSTVVDPDGSVRPRQ